MRERIRRLQAVADTSLLVNSTLDLAEIGEKIIDIATRLIGAERGSLFLVERERGTLRSLVAQGIGEGRLTLRIGDGLVGSVAAPGRAEILNAPYDDDRFDPRVDRVTGFHTRSLLTVPVRDRNGEQTAVLQLLNHRGAGFSEEDVGFLAELGVPFAIALTTARMHAEIVARERLDEELRLAAEIQRTLRPARDVEAPGLELDTLVEPCLEVGGDYWDLIPARDGARWWLVVADISGKGVAAGLIASNVQAALWSRRDDSRPLPEVVAGVNELLHHLTNGRKYATLVVAEWSPEERTLEWVNAGHPPLLVRRGDRVSAHYATGRPVGLLPDERWRAERTRLATGDCLLVYTDGVLEAGMTTAAGEFGTDRIERALAGGGDGASVVERLSAAIADHLDGSEPDDDVTVLCARVREE
jgi:sigma-B regulation protein RsbU (phosphoserine phosphatase)